MHKSRIAPFMAVRPPGLMNDCVRRKPFDRLRAFDSGLRVDRFDFTHHRWPAMSGGLSEAQTGVEWLPD